MEAVVGIVIVVVVIVVPQRVQCINTSKMCFENSKLTRFSKNTCKATEHFPVK